MSRAIPLLLCACAGGASTDTGPVTDAEITGATCAETENRLRFACAASVSPAAAATWTFTGDDGTTRTFATPAGPTTEVTAWGLPRRTEVTWQVEAGGAVAAGSFTTGGLPPGLGDLELASTGTAVTEGIGLVQVCGLETYLLIVDGRGRVVWYERTIPGPTGGGGYDFTASGTVVRSGRSEIQEIAMDGTVLWSVDGFDRPLHHDVRRGGDRVYALNAWDHGGYVLDGMYVIEDGAVVAEWDLADHVTPSGDAPPGGFWQFEFPGAEDWSHGNSIWSDGTDALVSLRWQDAVLHLDADPASPSFGAIDWILTGTGDEDLTGDFTWPDGGGFDGQHHATPIDGGLALFDNGPFSATSRALTIALDPAAGAARELASWDLGTHCDIQGSAFPLPDGGMLATCATQGRILEFAAGAAQPRFSLGVTCGLPYGGPSAVARGYPVDLP